MDKSYLIKGVNGQIILTKNRVKIARKGALGFLTSGLAGVKEIPIKNISSIQMKEATNVVNGYLQFSLPGGIESKKGIFDATHDENTVMFAKKHQEDFLTVKKYIDSIMDGEEINFDNLNLPLAEEDNKVSETQQVSTNSKIKKTFSWKYLIPIYGFYLIYKTDNAKKALSYILNIIVTIIVIAIFSGGDETNKSVAEKDSKNNTQTEKKVEETTLGKFSKENYNKIRNGMTQNQVKSILGEPESTSESEMPGFGKTDMWHYQDTSLFSNTIEGCQIYFSNGKVNMKNWTKL